MNICVRVYLVQIYEIVRKKISQTVPKLILNYARQKVYKEILGIGKLYIG